MQLSPWSKSKKLHINSLLIAHNMTLKGKVKKNVQFSQNQKQQNPQELFSPQHQSKQQKRRSLLTFKTITSGQKDESKKIQTQQNIHQKDTYPKTSNVNQLTIMPRQNLKELQQKRRQKKKCFSNQNNQYKHLSIEQKALKNLTFRNSCEQICQKSRKSSANSKRLEFESYQHSTSSHLKSLQNLTRVKSILKIYPNKSNNVRRNRKDTVMNQYDYECENIRLAQKILKMKPSKLCDIKEQMKFFKKQRYFKELRSCSIDSKEYLQQLDQISQSVTLPRINERYHTINC